MMYAAAAAIVLAAAVLVLDRLYLRRTLRTLDRMLDDAIRGSFCASHFDESRLSAVEDKMARFLQASGTSAAHLAEEKARVQGLIADISHQTKTPLASILLYAELLDSKDLPPDCRDCVEQLTGQAEKLQFLIASLVKTGRLETGVIAVHPQPDSLQELIGEAVSAAAAAAEAKGLALTALPTTAHACFDRKWTREALDNLLDNAIKYTPSGGSITVSVTPYELFCRIDVSDTGIGLTEAEYSRVFQRFYRSPAVRHAPGVGLGLYLVREIAAANGGYCKAASRPGGGSTFSLFLPMAYEKTQEPSQS